MNEAISLLVFSPVVSGDELGRTHANGVQLSDPVLQHHDLNQSQEIKILPWC